MKGLKRLQARLYKQFKRIKKPISAISWKSVVLEGYFSWKSVVLDG